MGESLLKYFFFYTYYLLIDFIWVNSSVLAVPLH